MHKLAKEVKLYHDANKWFWKSNKKDYNDMLIQLIKKDRVIQIQKYRKETISVSPVW